MGLSHIINAEGEKIQYALGTLAGVTSPPVTIQDILDINDSVKTTLGDLTQYQIFLNNKLKTALASSTMQGPTGLYYLARCG